MIFHEDPLLAEDSHEIPYLIFLKMKERCGKIYCLFQHVVSDLKECFQPSSLGTQFHRVGLALVYMQ